MKASGRQWSEVRECTDQSGVSADLTSIETSHWLILLTKPPLHFSVCLGELYFHADFSVKSSRESCTSSVMTVHGTLTRTSRLRTKAWSFSMTLVRELQKRFTLFPVEASDSSGYSNVSTTVARPGLQRLSGESQPTPAKRGPVYYRFNKGPLVCSNWIPFRRSACVKMWNFWPNIICLQPVKNMATEEKMSKLSTTLMNPFLLLRH